ncbi:MAG: hypothetical protein EXR31_08590 [Betaproteobacteria bacterium]|nr:hypothetical protein [Betaproteobacteria bacterium]
MAAGVKFDETTDVVVAGYGFAGAAAAIAAADAGLHCAWSNRPGDPLLVPEFAPDYSVRDLGGLLDIL